MDITYVCVNMILTVLVLTVALVVVLALLWSNLLGGPTCKVGVPYTSALSIRRSVNWFDHETNTREIAVGCRPAVCCTVLISQHDSTKFNSLNSLNITQCYWIHNLLGCSTIDINWRPDAINWRPTTTGSSRLTSTGDMMPSTGDLLLLVVVGLQLMASGLQLMSIVM